MKKYLIFFQIFITIFTFANQDFSYQDLTAKEFYDQDLTGANFEGATLNLSSIYRVNLTNANFTKADLTGVHFENVNFTNVDFTDAIINDTLFAEVTNFTKEQLYTTASYKNKDLSGFAFLGNMTGWDLSNQDLTNSFLPSSNLTNVNFTNALIKGASLFNLLGTFTKEQLYSTASYKNKDLNDINIGVNYLTGWNFANQNLKGSIFAYSILTNANFSGANLTGASFEYYDPFNVDIDDAFIIEKENKSKLRNVNFTNAIINNAVFNYATTTGFTKEQFYSTASYKNKDLSGINLKYNNLTGWNFVDQNLTDANFQGSNLSDATFEGANLTNANFQRATNFTIPQNAIFNHTVMPDGTIRNDPVSIEIESSPDLELTVFENTKYNLKVVAREANNKKLIYVWYVDKNIGKFVKAGSKPILTITPKSNMKGWRYYCEVSNQSKTYKTAISTITAVRTPVKITSKPKTLSTFEGVGNTGFSVSATGYDIKYQWQVYKIVGYNAKGKPIYDWVDISGTTFANYKPESDFENNGLKYRCKVYNDGSVVYTSGVKYTVYEAPKVDGIEVLQCKEKLSFDGSTVVAYEDYPIDLQATAKGYKIKYQWYKNGAAINGATKSKYTIKKPLESQDSYYCEVYNGDVKDQSSTFVLEVRECPMPASFEGHSLYVSDITDMGDPCRDMRMIFLNKNTLRVTMEDYEVSNPSFSYKRVSPTKATISLNFKLYDNYVISKANITSFSYKGEIHYEDGYMRLYLQDKKNGSYIGLIEESEFSDKSAISTLPINKAIVAGSYTMHFIDNKNFIMEGSGRAGGTYTYKSNKNGTGILKLTYKNDPTKTTVEIALIAFSENYGYAIITSNWNKPQEGGKRITTVLEEFEIIE